MNATMVERGAIAANASTSAFRTCVMPVSMAAVRLKPGLALDPANVSANADYSSTFRHITAGGLIGAPVNDLFIPAGLRGLRALR